MVHPTFPSGGRLHRDREFESLQPTSSAWDKYEYLTWKMTEDGLHMTERLKPERLREQDEKDMAIIWHWVHYGSCDPKVSNPMACAFLWETAHPHWVEIGSVWVKKENRRNGYSQQVIAAALRLDAAIGKSKFLITPMRSIMKGMEYLKFKPVFAGSVEDIGFWKNLLGNRLPDSALSSDPPPFTDGVRTLFLRAD